MSNLILNVEILGEFKKLTQATQGAQGTLNNLNKRANAISKTMNKAFAAIGIGLSFRVLANELEQATVAAIEDRKSMDLLAIAMTNTGKATDDTIKSAERAISKMQIQAGIADDKLRPAYQKLFIATGDVTRSNELMQIALDASAATGKDLETVTQAMAKSLAGNDAALAKLIPSLKGSKDPIAEMGKAFDGASAAAANLDPYQRMQIIFGEIQEKLGAALLPVLDDFAAWMSSPPGQKTLQEIADAAGNVLKELAATAKWVVANKDWLLPLATGAAVFAGAVKAIGTVTTAINTAKAAQDLFNISALKNPWVLGAAAAVGTGAALVDYAQTSNEPVKEILANRNAMIPSPDVIAGKLKAPTTTTNITINTPKVTAQEITNLVNKAKKNGYTGIITIPRSK